MKGCDRICKKCMVLKPVEDFYRHPASVGGRDTRCKECVKEMARANREEKAEYYRAYDRKRYREEDKRKEAAKVSALSEVGMEARRRATERSRREEPQKWVARNAVSNAIRDGRLSKGTHCYFCATTDRLQAHHEDYNHPLDVVWLCSTCHGKLHTIKGDFRRAG
jgi:hypothetical protein